MIIVSNVICLTLMDTNTSSYRSQDWETLIQSLSIWQHSMQNYYPNRRWPSSFQSASFISLKRPFVALYYWVYYGEYSEEFRRLIRALFPCTVNLWNWSLAAFPDRSGLGTLKKKTSFHLHGRERVPWGSKYSTACPFSSYSIKRTYFSNFVVFHGCQKSCYIMEWITSVLVSWRYKIL